MKTLKIILAIPFIALWFFILLGIKGISEIIQTVKECGEGFKTWIEL